MSIELHIRELEELGLLERTGEYRGGEPVFAISAYCERLVEESPELFELILRQDISSDRTKM